MAEKIILKYPLSAIKNRIRMPKGAEILSVQLQNNAFVLWAMVEVDLNPDEGESKEFREFEAVFTGEKIWPLKEGKERVYLNTIQNDDLDIHYFEIKDIDKREKTALEKVAEGVSAINSLLGIDLPDKSTASKNKWQQRLEEMQKLNKQGGGATGW